jgi:hypothetical protein
MNKESNITCPNCGVEIDISQSLYAKLEQKAKAELLKEVNEHRDKYKKAVLDLKAKEEAIKKEQEMFQQKLKDETAKKVEEELQVQKVKLESTLKDKIESEKSQELQLLQKELKEKSDQVKELNAKKAEIERLKREKDEIESTIKLKSEIELNEKLKEEKEKIAKQLDEQTSMKLKEKDEQLQQIKRQLEETKRKAEQGSQQIQGEAQELEIEQWLSSQFAFDEIVEVKKGVFGADCIQIIHTRELQNCGKICYESKNAKTFNQNWITKLKQDMLKVNADLGVLVTTIYPNDMDRMGFVDGIWVCSLEEFKGSSSLLRESIINVSKTLKKEENKTDKMSLLYNYLTSNEFSMQLNSIVEGFMKMQEELDKERRSLMASWKRRQKLIDGVLSNTTEMYGSLQGIAGNSIGHIKNLELPYEDEDE